MECRDFIQFKFAKIEDDELTTRFQMVPRIFDDRFPHLMWKTMNDKTDKHLVKFFVKVKFLVNTSLDKRCPFVVFKPLIELLSHYFGDVHSGHRTLITEIFHHQLIVSSCATAHVQDFIIRLYIHLTYGFVDKSLVKPE